MIVAIFHQNNHSLFQSFDSKCRSFLSIVVLRKNYTRQKMLLAARVSNTRDIAPTRKLSNQRLKLANKTSNIHCIILIYMLGQQWLGRCKFTVIIKCVYSTSIKIVSFLLKTRYLLRFYQIQLNSKVRRKRKNTDSNVNLYLFFQIKYQNFFLSSALDFYVSPIRPSCNNVCT